MTRKTGTTGPLAWDHAVHDIPDQGLSAVRQATPDELASIARALDLVACTSLRADYKVSATLGGRFHLTGRLRAEVSQTCVVTLEPVDSTIEEAFEAVFWPQEAMPAPESGEVAIDEEPEREPIVAGQLAVGRVVVREPGGSARSVSAQARRRPRLAARSRTPTAPTSPRAPSPCLRESQDQRLRRIAPSSMCKGGFPPLRAAENLFV